MNKVIAITGGIGAGKSVVSAILTCMGYEVYDCDLNARQIMETSTEIKQTIASEICPEAILADGTIDRAALGRHVFSDKVALEQLNSIVHSHVRNHFREWSAAHDKCFVETAILHSSHMDALVDEIWEVTAPVEVRIERVMHRNKLSRAEIERRIEAQQPELDAPAGLKKTVILNDGITPLLPRIERLL